MNLKRIKNLEQEICSLQGKLYSGALEPDHVGMPSQIRECLQHAIDYLEQELDKELHSDSAWEQASEV